MADVDALTTVSWLVHFKFPGIHQFASFKEQVPYLASLKKEARGS